MAKLLCNRLERLSIRHRIVMGMELLGWILPCLVLDMLDAKISAMLVRGLRLLGRSFT